ncbi:MAG: nucleoside monophosphate kinase [Holosporales bacterium]|jgi:adenylate kinase|nr:nucleoside monophosphate kinase [Holosporales bacterium]
MRFLSTFISVIFLFIVGCKQLNTPNVSSHSTSNQNQAVNISKKDSKCCVVILVGLPGSGKGTHSEYLCKKLGFTYFSMGEALRQEIASGSELGKKVKPIYNAGKLVPDEAADQIMQKFFSTMSSNKLLFDGFPRMVPQAKLLHSSLKKIFVDMNIKVLLLDISEDIAKERVVERFFCKECKAIYTEKTMPFKNFRCKRCGSIEFIKRTDDNAAIFAERVKVYKNETLPVLDFYKELGISYHVIDTSLSVEEVSKKIEKIILKN